MTITLESKIPINSGYEIPVTGLGTYNSKGREVEQAVLWAIKSGYRLIDTATFYGNEKEIGRGIEKSGIKRGDLFITSKVWESDHGLNKPLKAINRSLEYLGVDYLDLYLLHWPHPGTRLKTWKAMEKILDMGLARSIGVSNFTIEHLEELKTVSDITPAINQIEFHPFQFEDNLLQYCKKRGIVVQAHTPLIRGRKNHIPQLTQLEVKYKKSPGQILLRWCIQHGTIPLPKSSNRERIKENTEIFDFQLSESDMKLLDNIGEEYRVVLWNPNSSEWR